MEQVAVKPEDRWFNTIDAATLCRGGGNGSNHPSQLYAIVRYVQSGMSFLDYGCGSGTTYEAIRNGTDLKLKYRGADIIPKFTEWCKENFPEGDWVTYKSEYIEEPDGSWDVVYSRHVVDHQKSFEFGLDEHCRVARKFVIIVLWVGLSDRPEHDIKNIVDQGKVYGNEYTNQYSRSKVLEAIKAKEKDGWRLYAFAEDVGAEVNKHDVVIVLGK